MGILRVNQISGTETQLSTLGIGTTAPVTGSVFFDGSGDSITISPTNSLFLDKVFTIEFWAFPNSSAAVNGDSPTILSFPTSSGINTTKVYISSTSNFFGLHNGTSDVVSTGTSSVVLNTWSHVAITRDSSDTCRIFLNGSLINSATSTVAFGNTTTSLRIGSLTASNGSYNGFISNLRIRKGTAGYTTSFTPPTLILEEIGDTSLLCCNNADSAGAAVGTAVTASPLTLVGNTTSFSNNPGLVRNFTSGTQFTGVTRLDTQGFIVPPSGTTAQQFPDFAGVSAASARGVFAGGYITPAFSNIIDFVTISTLGNAIDFGDLFQARRASSSAASPIRGVFSGGYSPSILNTIDFVTISSTGNASDFGDLTNARRSSGACSNSTRALFAGGVLTPGGFTNTIDYVTIFSAGIAIDFGDVITAAEGMSGCGSPTRGLFGGGSTPTGSDVIQYVTISTTANTVDFGDLTVARWVAASFSNSTRGLWAGGRTPTAQSIIDYVTISSLGNAVTFGDLTVAKLELSGCASSTRGLVAGGFASPANTNVIEHVTIATTGSAVSFGNLTAARAVSSCSNGHGGLG